LNLVLESIRGVVLNGINYFSVLDFVNIVCGRPKMDKYATKFLQNNKLVFPKYKFFGQHQYETPIATLFELQEIFSMLGTKAASTFRKSILMTFNRVMAGDLSLIKTIEDNNKSTAPEVLMSREICLNFTENCVPVEDIFKNNEDLCIEKQVEKRTHYLEEKIDKMEKEFKDMKNEFDKRNDDLKTKLNKKEMILSTRTLEYVDKQIKMNKIKPNIAFIPRNNIHKHFIIVMKKNLNLFSCIRPFIGKSLNKREKDFKYYFVRIQEYCLKPAIDKLKKRYPYGEIKIKKMTSNPMSLTNVLRVTEGIIHSHYMNHFNVYDINLLKDFINNIANLHINSG